MVPILVGTFFVTCIAIYLAMRFVCWMKKKYGETEHWLVKLIESFECVQCREACMNHTKLIARAILFGSFVTFVVFIVLLIAG
jgi:hypothetical protein